MGLQIFTGNWPFLKSVNYISPSVTTALLWLNVLLPWLLVGALAGFRRLPEKSPALAFAATS